MPKLFIFGLGYSAKRIAQRAQSLGWEVVATGSEGKLSKRLGSLGVAHFREIGLEPMAIASLLARLGSSQPIEPFASLAPLIFWM